MAKTTGCDRNTLTGALVKGLMMGLSAGQIDAEWAADAYGQMVDVHAGGAPGGAAQKRERFGEWRTTQAFITMAKKYEGSSA